MSKNNNDNKSSLDDLQNDLQILDNTELLNVIGGKSQTVNWDTGLPGIVPQ